MISIILIPVTRGYQRRTERALAALRDDNLFGAHQMRGNGAHGANLKPRPRPPVSPDRLPVDTLYGTVVNGPRSIAFEPRRTRQRRLSGSFSKRADTALESIPSLKGMIV